MKLALKWIAGVSFLFTAAALIIDGTFASAALYLVAGLVCLPPALEWIEGKTNFTFQSWQKYIIVIFGMSLGGALMRDVGNTTDTEQQTATTQSTQKTAPQMRKKSADEELGEQLQREIDAFKKPFDNSTYRGSKDAVFLEVALFFLWADVIKKGEESTDPKNQALAKELKPKVVALQVKEFPLMRKEITRISDEKLWENNIEVACFGKGYTTLDFVGGAFANNMAIKKSQEGITEMLHQLRFKQTQYRWFDGADEYTYYEISSPNDDELVTVTVD